MKSNLEVYTGSSSTNTFDVAKEARKKRKHGLYIIDTICLTGQLVETYVGILHEPGHDIARIIAMDITGDMKPEILIGRNKLSTTSDYRFLPNSRDYDAGFISCLAWNGKSMTELWRTNLLNGYIADYQFQLNQELM